VYGYLPDVVTKLCFDDQFTGQVGLDVRQILESVS
jgi:hypothetical protein